MHARNIEHDLPVQHFLPVIAQHREPASQGVECAGNGNTGIQFLYNTFTAYSDGLQLNTAPM
jgi:hypothetical protein